MNKKSPRKYWLLALTILMGLGFTLLLTRPFIPTMAAPTIFGIEVDSDSDSIADDGFCTLREAITNANNDTALYGTAGECAAGSGTDTITFAGDYTITIGSTLPQITSNIIIDGSSQSVVVNGADSYRVLDVAASTGFLNLEGLTIANGHVTDDKGGGIYNAGSLVVTRGTFSGNSTSSSTGGGTYDGAGIYNTGTLAVTSSTFSGNTANRGSGGGIYNEQYGTITTIANSTFSGNSAFYGGGGIFNSYDTTITSIVNSTFSGNSAQSGGGIGNNSGTITLIANSTFFGNSATSSNYGGGIYTYLGPSITIANTIVANSPTGGNCYGITTGTNSLSDDGTCGFAGGGGSDNDASINLDPLADNGGPTWTFALLAGSTAIDTGDATTCANAPVNGLDQRGVIRPQGAGCDIGAVEMAFHVTGTSPDSNALDVTLTAPVSATFNLALGTGTVSTSTFVVHGGFSGRSNGAFTFSEGNTRLDFDPAVDFKPGEIVQVSASDRITGTLGTSLEPYVWNFTAATARAGGNMRAHPVSPNFGGNNSAAVALGDLDGDNDLDAVIGNYNQGETVWINDGTGIMTAHPVTATFGATTNGVSLGDLDGDGDLDAMIPSTGQSVWLNDGDGGFYSHPTSTSINGLCAALGDLDGDGDLDAVFPNYNSAQTTWLNDGSGVFTAHPSTPSFGAGISWSLALGDLDGDGDLDAVDPNWGEGQTVWLNDGTGAFSAHPVPTFGTGSSQRLALGDLDGDGDLDVVVTSNGPNFTWINDGTGTFSAHPSVPSFGGGNGYAIALGDLDGDGDLDAVFAGETTWLNDGTGGFSPHPRTPGFGGGNTRGIDLGDLDGDGDLDAVVANQSSQAQTVWLNSDYMIYLPLIMR